jgi:hypothetical protein
MRARKRRGRSEGFTRQLLGYCRKSGRAAPPSAGGEVEGEAHQGGDSATALALRITETPPIKEEAPKEPKRQQHGTQTKKRK